jgi:hypothetical protein
MDASCCVLNVQKDDRLRRQRRLLQPAGRRHRRQDPRLRPERKARRDRPLRPRHLRRRRARAHRLTIGNVAQKCI